MPAREQVTEAAGRYARAVSSGDKAAILGCFAAGATVVDPYPAPAHVGLAAIADFWDVVLSVAAPQAFTIEEMAVAGDSAAFLFSLVITVAGEQLAMRGFDVIRVDDDGKIESLTAYVDPGTLAPIAGN
jgi:ketosteroid isomerase-like protein